MQAPAKPPSYRSYVLRLWEERSEQPALVAWRCSLEDPLTDRRHGFASLATDAIAALTAGVDLLVLASDWPEQQLLLALLVQAAQRGLLPPAELAPADSSSSERPQLAAMLRVYHPNVDESILPINPSPADVAAMRETAATYDRVVIGTINANQHPGQAALVNALVDLGCGPIAQALRMPHDMLAYAGVPTFVCTYSLQPPALEALAQALVGRLPFVGRLPITVPGL